MSESPVDKEHREENAAPTGDDVEKDDAVAPAAGLSDDDSELSEVDEEEIGTFDVNQMDFEEEIDADNLKSITRSKRQRQEGDEPKKKKREGRKERQLQKKSRRRRGEEDEEVTGDATITGGRRRRRAAGEEGEKRVRQVRQETPEDQLSDGERKRRQLQKNVERILKKPKVRRRRAGEHDLENPMEEEVQRLHDNMVEAARLDSEARKAEPPQPATHKLKMLPEVTSMLNRTGREAESILVDPEINLMETVKFFLEPLRTVARRRTISSATSSPH